MRLDLLRRGTWDQCNQVARAWGGFADNLEVRCFRGLAAALLETFTGTASFLSHKRTLGVIQGQSWVPEAVLPHLLRENFQIKSYDVSALSNPEALLQDLGDDCSVVVWPEDHPITGELFDGSALEAMLAKKRIFSVRLSHQAFWFRKIEPGPYTVRLCSVAPNLAVAIAGIRFKTPPWLAPYESWDARAVTELLNSAPPSSKEDLARVESFESSLGGGWEPLLRGRSRLGDRAIVTHLEKSGEKVLHDLARAVGQTLPLPGERGWIETLNLCRWGGTLRQLSWWSSPPVPERLRGSVLLDVSMLDHPVIKRSFEGTSNESGS